MGSCASLVSIEGEIFGKCMESVPIQAREEFGYMRVCTNQEVAGSIFGIFTFLNVGYFGNGFQSAS